MVEVNGYCTDHFEPFRQACINNFSEGREMIDSCLRAFWAAYKSIAGAD